MQPVAQAVPVFVGYRRTSTIKAISRIRRPPEAGRTTHTFASLRGRFVGTVAPAVTRSRVTFRRTNALNRRARRRRQEPAGDAAIAAAGPSGGPLRPAHHARRHLKRGFRRDVKVPATNEATNNPAGRARRSARGRHALASPCRTP
ncbi:hypothetical protein DF041_36610 [Burkholderia cepacia]|nr:hypothetical protein DF041_36610 [Burkholderia cepacia]